MSKRCIWCLIYNARRVTRLSGNACWNQTVADFNACYHMSWRITRLWQEAHMLWIVCRFLPVFLVNNVSSGNFWASCQHQHIERSSLKGNSISVSFAISGSIAHCLQKFAKKAVVPFIAVRKSWRHFPRIIIFQIISSRPVTFLWQDYSPVLMLT